MVGGGYSATERQIPDVTTAVSITSGGNFNCAVLADRTAKCWGSNITGQLGNGSYTDSPTPVVVLGLSGVVALTGGYDHSCAVLADGTARCWGGNAVGQLGNDSLVGSPTPVPVRTLTQVRSISAGVDRTCATEADGSASCWGWNRHGYELGSGTAVDSSTPVAAPDITNAAAIVYGESHACVLSTAGSIGCFGDNSYGQLGIDTVANTPALRTVTGY